MGRVRPVGTTHLLTNTHLEVTPEVPVPEESLLEEISKVLESPLKTVGNVPELNVVEVRDAAVQRVTGDIDH